MSRPLAAIGIALGDPAGIGPEVVAKAIRDLQLPPCQLICFGHSGHVLALPAELSAWYAALPAWSGRGEPGIYWASVASGLPAVAPTFGQFSDLGGQLQRAALDAAIDAAISGATDAVVTAPVNKRIFSDDPGIYGQSELLAARTQTEEWAMMLCGDKLAVVLVTTHIPLADVASALSSDAVYRKLLVAHRALGPRYGRAPRIGLCALNPHAGEGGLCGDEEQRLLLPAVQRARAQGLDVSDPLPSDTLFYRAVQGQFDLVVALYHDQGLIPLKLLHFSDGVNVTIGLPIVRTSPDHGVAYDIAGMDRADSASMAAAIRYALESVALRAD